MHPVPFVSSERSESREMYLLDSAQKALVRCGARPYSPQAFDAAPEGPEQAKRVEGSERY